MEFLGPFFLGFAIYFIVTGIFSKESKVKPKGSFKVTVYKNGEITGMNTYTDAYFCVSYSDTWDKIEITN